MTYNPRSLQDLGAYWTIHGGVNLGVVGNDKHCAGYHLGRDRIYSACACRPDGTCEPGRGAKDYSVTNSRDKAGLTNAASAIDLGKLGGTYAGLRVFSTWLVMQCQAKAPGYRDVREIIYSPDGIKVQRYSGIDGAIHTGPGNGDGSHTTHTHISYFRDSEDRDKTLLFAPYFLPDTSIPPEDNVLKPGDDFNGGWERWTLDGMSTVYSIGGPRKDDGSTDGSMRLCFNGDPTKPLFTVVDRQRLTNGAAVSDAEEAKLWAAIASGKLPPGDATHTVTLAVDGQTKATVTV